MSEEVEDSEVQSPDMDKLTRAYLAIRDAKEVLTDQYKKQVAELDEQMQVIEQELLEHCKNMNASSVRTPHGTVIRSVKSRYWTNDWDSMYDFIEETGAFGLLEKRIHQTHMKEFLSENPDMFPKGMNVENEYTVVVRRSKGN
jgi:uncharacterized protein YuzB (UPF0349 family)